MSSLLKYILPDDNTPESSDIVSPARLPTSSVFQVHILIADIGDRQVILSAYHSESLAHQARVAHETASEYSSTGAVFRVVPVPYHP